MKTDISTYAGSSLPYCLQRTVRLSEVYTASVCGRVATGPKTGRRVAVGGDHVDPEGIDSSAGPRCAAVHNLCARVARLELVVPCAAVKPVGNAKVTPSHR